MLIAMPVEIGDEMTGFPLSNEWSLVFRQLLSAMLWGI